MEILSDTTNVPPALKGSVLAIGNFDGVHRGHQAVLRTAKELAESAGAPTGVMAFEPHPRQFFQPDKPLFRLTSLPVKLELFEAMGLDLAVVLPFDAQLASLMAEEFVRKVLVGGLGIRHAVIGYDFHFGKGRQGTPQVLFALGQRYGFGVSVVEPVGEGGAAFSSSMVRNCLRAGDPHQAAEILGYWWRISGTVVGGAKRGTGLGYPTANVEAVGSLELKHGTYAVRVALSNGEKHIHGAAYFGTRPTFESGPPAFEVFLFDFDGDLYDQVIEVEIIAYLRGDAKFVSAQELKAQMQADCAEARKILNEIEAHDPMRAFPLGNRLAQLG